MYVRFKTGPRAGEVAEMKFMDARPLLDDGRAEPAYPHDIAPAELPATRLPAETHKANSVAHKAKKTGTAGSAGANK